MANLTDADKVLRNDTGKDIVSKLDDIVNAIQASNIPDAEDVSYDNSDSGLSATNVQDAIDEVESRLDTAESDITNLDTDKVDKTNPTSTGTLSHTGNATISGSVTAVEGFVGDVDGTASNADTVNNLTVLTAVPANAVFTDTDELADLKDVEFVNLTDGQVIVWNATEGKFKNITLPDPMVFRGSLGVGGTIEALPVDGSATVGDTYKVITDGTYAEQTAKIGDTFICLTKTMSSNTWVYIPSGDEPSGTVTSIKIQANSPIVIDDDSAITTSGVRTLSHANSGATAGSYGDSTAQTPAYGATFKVPFITVDDKGHITSISEHTVKIPESDNTTYTLGTSGDTVTLTPSDGDSQSITVPFATNSNTVNNHTVNSDVPSGAIFTDTTNALGISYDPTTSGLSATNAQTAIDELRELDPQVKTVSGSIATFTDGGDNIPVKSFECDIVAQQESGTPTPSSPLPITGFSEANVSRTGKNLFDKTATDTTKGYINGYYLLSNGNTNQGSEWNVSEYIKVNSNDKYVVSGISGNSPAICFYNSNKEYISGTSYNGSLSVAVTTPNNCVYARVSYNDSTINTVQLESGSTATEYESYVGNAYLVEFGQTVYGGRLIYANGQWAIEATHFGFKGTGLNLVKSSTSGNLSTFNITLSSNSFPSAKAQTAKSSHFSLAIASGSGRMAQNSTNIFLIIDNTLLSEDTAVGFVNWLIANDVTIFYECTTPTIIPLTSTVKLKTVSGSNNIYSNTGDCEVKYFTDGCDSIVDIVEQVSYTKEQTDAEINNSVTIDTYSGLQTTDKTVIGAINEVNAKASKVEVTGTLTAGQTSITLSDASITASSFIQVFADNGNVNYTSISATTGSVTIGFLAQASDMTVTVRVS